jgi:hypothetical protein
MRIKTEENAITAEVLKAKLEEQFPNYEFSMRGKKMIVVKQSVTSGTNILISKKKITVQGAFPTLGGQLLFSLSLVLLGILIPIVVYFAAFRPAQIALEKEVGAFIQDETAV